MIPSIDELIDARLRERGCPDDLLAAWIPR